MRVILLAVGIALGIVLASPGRSQNNPGFNPNQAWGGVQGSLAFRGPANWQGLLPGTAGQALLSGGPGANPYWNTVTGIGTVTSINGASTATGLALSGGPITGAGTLTLSGNVVNQAIAGTGIGVSGATGNVTISNAGVTSAIAGNGIAVSGATGNVTVSLDSPDLNANRISAGLGSANTNTQTYNSMATPDAEITYMLGTAKFGVATDLGFNAIVGAGVTRQPNIFPTGVTGYWSMPLAGSTGFGMYAQCNLQANGSCNNEFSARNFSGPAPTNGPGNWSFGTTDNISVGLHVGGGGTFQPGIGISIGQDGGSPQSFLNGLYMWGVGGPTQHGLYIDATSTSSPQYSARIKNTGQGTNIPVLIETTGTPVDTNSVIEHRNNLGVPTFTIRQNGGASFNGQVSSSENFVSAPIFPSNIITSSGNALDIKTYDTTVYPDGTLHLRLRNDANSSSTTAMRIDRSGITPTLVTFGSPIVTDVKTFSTLGTCAQGARSFITDGASSTFYAVASGGGSLPVPVFCDGTIWRVG